MLLNKTVETYKWIWREIVELMETRPDKFFVIMTGSASGDENNTPTGARLAHEFAVWAKDTLANGNDPVYGAFPENVYVFDYFHYLADNEYYLKDEYESGYQGISQDDHPNATACNDIAPIFVQEVFDAAITYETTLPVELTSFSASIIGSTIKLTWETATETNNFGFEVERKVGSPLSTVGNFEKIDFVNGNGNSNSPKSYSFIDDKISAGKYSYRLKQIDNDGKFEYSNIVEVSFMEPIEFSLEQNYPNPFNPITRIEFSILEDVNNVTLTIFNTVGERVAELVNSKLETGKYVYDLNAIKLATGLYFYELRTDKFVSIKKMLLLK